MIPIIQSRSTFASKVGDNEQIMFNLTDRGGRDLCLAPEYTAVIQGLKDTFKYQKDVKLFYVGECFRGERPQAGRYRQFTQLGVEIINPTRDYTQDLIDLAQGIVFVAGFDLGDWEVNRDVKRGLDYYIDGQGFEITCDKLGAQKQLVGGGKYEGGVGFAVGIDRLLLLPLNERS